MFDRPAAFAVRINSEDKIVSIDALVIRAMGANVNNANVTDGKISYFAAPNQVSHSFEIAASIK